MNELDQKLAAARETLAGADPHFDYQHTGLSELRALVAAIDASGVIQDSARWQWELAELERVAGIPRERYTRVVDATMAKGRA